MKLRKYFYVRVTEDFRTFISANMDVKIYLSNNLKFDCKYVKIDAKKFLLKIIFRKTKCIKLGISFTS